MERHFRHETPAEWLDTVAEKQNEKAGRLSVQPPRKLLIWPTSGGPPPGIILQARRSPPGLVNDLGHDAAEIPATSVFNTVRVLARLI